jgi:hypothetical protein
MVLLGKQIQRCGPAGCNLVPAQSPPHDPARSDGRALPLTSIDFGGVTDPYIDERWIWTYSPVSWPISFPATRARCRVAHLPTHRMPDA